MTFLAIIHGILLGLRGWFALMATSEREDLERFPTDQLKEVRDIHNEMRIFGCFMAVATALVSWMIIYLPSP